MSLKNKPDSYWKEKLTPEQYDVLINKKTEFPFTGEYVKFNEEGVYTCAACGQALFTSDQKFDSWCGWPSFSDLAKEGVVELVKDTSHNMVRDEVVCSNCGGHLGHLFDDGPNPTGLRYCINSRALKFKKDSAETKQAEVK